MNRRREALLLGLAGLAATAAGFLAGPALLKLGGDGDETNALRAAKFSDLDGKVRQMSEWSGKILVCNFWATWCAPCREEIPLLIGARQKYAQFGVEIVGIAIDNADKVRQYASFMNIPYPILMAEADGLDLMRRLGNGGGGLPYTVVTGRLGNVAHRKLGAFRGSELDGVLAPLAGS
jgi:thiol-disulfide isomerase/thioredoxin